MRAVSQGGLGELQKEKSSHRPCRAPFCPRGRQTTEEVSNRQDSRAGQGPILWLLLLKPAEAGFLSLATKGPDS